MKNSKLYCQQNINLYKRKSYKSRNKDEELLKKGYVIWLESNAIKGKKEIRNMYKEKFIQY